MSSTTVVRHADRPDTPWRNGAGTTRELLSAPARDEPTRFAWRVSVATVAQDSTFSTFEGVDRVLLLCSGDGMTLEVDGVAQALRHLEPVAFPGEAHVESRLPGGPTRDLNVMTVRGTVEALVRVQPVEGRLVLGGPAAPRPPGGAVEVVAVVLEGEVSLVAEDGGSVPTPLALLDAVHVPPGREAELHGHGRIAHVVLTTRTPMNGAAPCT